MSLQQALSGGRPGAWWPCSTVRQGASLLLACMVGAAGAQGVVGATGKAAEPSAWLERIRQAAQQRSFAGTLVYTAADVVSSSRVQRFGMADSVYERVEVLDGRQQRSFRHNESVHTIWPEQRVVTVERRSVVDETVGFPLLEVRAQASYEVRQLGEERIAGRSATVLLLKPRDEQRFAQRMWADTATGLLLRADVLSAHGQVLESTSFSTVELDMRATRADLINPARRLEGYRTVQLSTEATSLETEGWVADKLPAGFKLLGCVQRVVGDPAEASEAKAGRALQAVYSDGLARVSVFIEAVDPARPRSALMTHLGATHTLMKPIASRWWITVMGDVPMNTLKSFADAVGRKP